MKQIRLSFGERLGDLVAERMVRGRRLTEAKIAAEIGISRSVFSEYKNPKDTSRPKVPRLDTLLRMADYFQVSLDYLAGRSSFRSDNTRHRTVEELGLSEQAVNVLLRCGRDERKKAALEQLLTAPDLDCLLDGLAEYEEACTARELTECFLDQGIPPEALLTEEDRDVREKLDLLETARLQDHPAAEYLDRICGEDGCGLVDYLRCRIGSVLEDMLLQLAEQVEERIDRRRYRLLSRQSPEAGAPEEARDP